MGDWLELPNTFGSRISGSAVDMVDDFGVKLFFGENSLFAREIQSLLTDFPRHDYRILLTVMLDVAIPFNIARKFFCYNALGLGDISTLHYFSFSYPLVFVPQSEQHVSAAT